MVCHENHKNTNSKKFLNRDDIDLFVSNVRFILFWSSRIVPYIVIGSNSNKHYYSDFES